MLSRSAVILSWALALSLSLLPGMGCVTAAPRIARYDYFRRPVPDDAWTRKIAGWQQREQSEDGAVLAVPPPVAEAGAPVASGPPVSGASALRDAYFSFRAQRRRSMASHFADWVQSEAKQHYYPDGPIDHWATLEETLKGDGDDCDGLELLVYHGLRDLGFSEREVYRSIVYRPADGQHHMVTLWFEDPGDPWVIDPTGAMSIGMQRMSALSDWVPLKVFSTTAEFTVQPLPARSAAPVPASVQ